MKGTSSSGSDKTTNDVIEQDKGKANVEEVEVEVNPQDGNGEIEEKPSDDETRAKGKKMIEQAGWFLKHPSIVGLSSVAKDSYLKSQGLSDTDMNIRQAQETNEALSSHHDCDHVWKKTITAHGNPSYQNITNRRNGITNMQ